MARALDADVSVESMFEAADNVAITAFDVRPSSALDSAGQAFLEVANYSSTSQSVKISVARGNASLLDLTMVAAGAAVQRVVLLDRRGDARLRARISAPANALVVDDEAVAWIAGAQPVTVTIVSDQAASFGPLLSQIRRSRRRSCRRPITSPGAEAVVIFDRVVPAVEPTMPALYIVPTAATWIGVPGTTEAAPQWMPGAWHPMLYGVDVQSMSLERARAYAGKGLDAIAFCSATRTPLIYVRNAPDQRFAIFTFSVTESKLMFAPGFPPLMGNAIDWLAHPVPSAARRPGPATFNARLATIAGPDGKAVPVTEVNGVWIRIARSPRLLDLKSAGASSVMAVNAGDPDTSDLRRTRLPASTRANAASSPLRSRPWWLLAAAAALFLLAAEWWTWQRRVTV